MTQKFFSRKLIGQNPIRCYEVIEFLNSTSKHNQTPTEFVKQNMDTIIKKMETEDLYFFITNIEHNTNFENIIRDYLPSILYNFSNCKNETESERKFYSLLSDGSIKYNEITEANIDLILEHIRPSRFFDFSQKTKNISSDIRYKLNEYYKTHKTSVLSSIFNYASLQLQKLIGLDSSTFDKLYSELLESNNCEFDLFIPTLTRLVDELIESENIEYTDISVLGQGSYSTAYGFGNKVLKFGEPVCTHNIPNHKRILQPLFRINLHDTHQNPLALLQVTEKVDTNLSKQDINQETLYYIYKELRDDGIIFTDLKPSNLGKLLKPNYTYLNGEPVEINPTFNGLDKSIDEDVLTTGELVIIDLDHIYREDAPNIIWRSTPKEFEERYRRERNGNPIDDSPKQDNKSQDDGDER